MYRCQRLKRPPWLKLPSLTMGSEHPGTKQGNSNSYPSFDSLFWLVYKGPPPSSFREAVWPADTGPHHGHLRKNHLSCITLRHILTPPPHALPIPLPCPHCISLEHKLMKWPLGLLSLLTLASLCLRPVACDTSQSLLEKLLSYFHTKCLKTLFARMYLSSFFFFFFFFF